MAVHFHCDIYHKINGETLTLAKGEGDTPIAALKVAMDRLYSPGFHIPTEESVAGGDWKEWSPYDISDGWQKEASEGKLIIFPYYLDPETPNIGALGLDDLVDDGGMSLEQAEGFIAEGLSLLTAN